MYYLNILIINIVECKRFLKFKDFLKNRKRFEDFFLLEDFIIYYFLKKTFLIQN